MGVVIVVEIYLMVFMFVFRIVGENIFLGLNIGMVMFFLKGVSF